MSIKVGINGFGRIGRLVFRAAVAQPETFEIVGINDPFIDLDYMVYMVKYDTMHGHFDGTVKAENGKLVVNGKEISVFAEKEPSQIPWGAVEAEYVVESTGVFCTTEKASAHIQAGAKKVVISAPAGNDVPTVVYGVNENIITKDDHIISAASCTTNCLAPMANALNNYAPIISGIMTTVHAYTGDQMILDGPHRKGDLRRARAGAINIVPNSTGAAKAIGLVIPSLSGKLIGGAQRVPVPDGSLTILDAVVDKEVTKEEINEMMKSVQSDAYGYTDEEIVSSDIIGDTHGSIFDATQTKVISLGDGKTLVQVVAWYDNENSYTSQMVRTAKKLVEVMETM